MKRINVILFLLISFLYSKSQSYELAAPHKDTINMTDVNGKKQGQWIIFGRHAPSADYKPNQKISEGIYKDNRKTGVWIDYYPSGNIKNKVTFVEGRPHGPVYMYFQNGNIQEEGTWKNNRWVGNYKLTDENGTITEKYFDDQGKEISSKITSAKNSVPSEKSK